MKYFGEAHDAPVYESAESAETPVGKNCLPCGIAIEAGDDGFLIPNADLTGVHELPWHRQCFLNNILGQSGHFGG